VREGVIASRIAAHAADIAKGVPGAMEWDKEMARRRKALDWKGQIELSINPERARKLRESQPAEGVRRLQHVRRVLLHEGRVEVSEEGREKTDTVTRGHGDKGQGQLRIAERQVQKAEYGMQNKIINSLLSSSSVRSREQLPFAVEPSIVIAPKTIFPGGLMVVTVKKTAGPVEGSFNGKHLYFNPAKKAYQAVVGIDLNADPGTYPLALTVDGRSIKRDVVIARKKYPVQKLTLPEDMVVLSPENEARTEREQRRMAAIWPFDSLRVWRGSLSTRCRESAGHALRRAQDHQQHPEESALGVTSLPTKVSR